MSQATEIFNRPIAYNHATRQMLAAQGFVDIEERIIRIPMSTWSRDRIEKKLANWLQLVLVGEDGLEAYSLGPLTRAPVSWPADQVTRLCKEVGAEIVNRNFHMYNNMYVQLTSFSMTGLAISMSRTVTDGWQAYYHRPETVIRSACLLVQKLRRPMACLLAKSSGAAMMGLGRVYKPCAAP